MDGHIQQPVLSTNERRFLLSLAARIVPESAGATTKLTDPLLDAIDQQLRPRPRLQQLEFRLLLFAIRWMTVPFTLRWFERLPGDRQDRWLRFLENAPLTLVRAGIWGLKTLVFLGYYTQDAVRQQIRYFPSKEDGNLRLHDPLFPRDG